MWPFSRKKKEDKVPDVKEAKPSNVRVYPRVIQSGDSVPRGYCRDVDLSQSDDYSSTDSNSSSSSFD